MKYCAERKPSEGCWNWMLSWEKVMAMVGGSGSEADSGVGSQVQVGGSMERLYECV